MSYEDFDQWNIDISQVDLDESALFEVYGFDTEDYEAAWNENEKEDNFPGDDITETYFDFNDYEYQQQLYL